MINAFKFSLVFISFLACGTIFAQKSQKADINQLTPQELRSRLNDFLSSPAYAKELKQIDCEIEPDSLEYSNKNGSPDRFNLKYLPKTDKELSDSEKMKIENIIKDPLLENFLGNFKGGVANTEQMKAIKDLISVSPRAKSDFDKIIKATKEAGKALDELAPANPKELEQLKNTAEKLKSSIEQGAVPGSGSGGGGPGSGSGGGGPGSGSGGGGPGSGSGGGGPGSGSGGGGPGSGSGGGGPGDGLGRTLAGRGLDRLIDGINNRIKGTAPIDSSKPLVDLTKPTKNLEDLLVQMSNGISISSPVRSPNVPYETNSQFLTSNSAGCCVCPCVFSNWVLVPYCTQFVSYVKQGCGFHKQYVPFVFSVPTYAWVQMIPYPSHYQTTPPPVVSQPVVGQQDFPVVTVPANMDSETAFSMGKLAYQDNKLAESLEYLNHSLSLNPNNVIGWHYRAVTQLQLGQVKLAEESAKKAGAFFVSHPENRISTLSGLERIQGSARSFLVEHRLGMTETEALVIAKAELPKDLLARKEQVLASAKK